MQFCSSTTDEVGVTRISAATMVQAFVILVTAVVFGLMIFGPSDPSGQGSMSGSSVSGINIGGVPAGSRSMESHNGSGH